MHAVKEAQKRVPFYLPVNIMYCNNKKKIIEFLLLVSYGEIDGAGVFYSDLTKTVVFLCNNLLLLLFFFFEFFSFRSLLFL